MALGFRGVGGGWDFEKSKLERRENLFFRGVWNGFSGVMMMEILGMGGICMEMDKTIDVYICYTNKLPQMLKI